MVTGGRLQETQLREGMSAERGAKSEMSQSVRGGGQWDGQRWEPKPGLWGKAGVTQRADRESRGTDRGSQPHPVRAPLQRHPSARAEREVA